MKAHSRFVANFAAARRAIGLTQQKAAERMRCRLHGGWNTRSVENFERGHREVTITEAECLAAIVCVPLDRMFTGSASHVIEIAASNMRTGAPR